MVKMVMGDRRARLRRARCRAALMITGSIALGMLVVSPPADAYPRPGDTERLSVGLDGAEPNSSATSPVISADGRVVAFSSFASNIVAGDTNNRGDIFVRDLDSGTLQRVSVGADGEEGDGSASSPSLTADGRYVAFSSHATNLVPGDTNDEADVFVHDRLTGSTQRASTGPEEADGASTTPVISADGRSVAFVSAASNLVPDDTNDRNDVFVRDLQAGTTERVSVSSDGAESDQYSRFPSISADGRYVAFASFARNLVSGDTNGDQDIFVHDRHTGTTERASLIDTGKQGDGYSGQPSISADGRYVAFESRAALVQGDVNGEYDIYRFDRETTRISRVSVGSVGEEGDGPSRGPVMTPDGTRVAFISLASTLVPGDTNNAYDVFVHDLRTGATERVSVRSTGGEANAKSQASSISSDGRRVVFSSLASNLVSGDTNVTYDVFLRDRGLPAGVLGEMTVREETAGMLVFGRATLSGATLTAATDPDDDAIAADVLGAEITGAGMVYRPEEEDLWLRLDLAALPAVESLLPVRSSLLEPIPEAGLPGVVYGFSFQVGSTTFEAQVSSAGASADGARSPSATLYRCEPVCREEGPIDGHVGTTGPQVLLSIPLGDEWATEGTSLTGPRAYSGVGDGTGGMATFDELTLSDVVLPVSRVELGTAGISVPESEVAYAEVSPLLRGEFAALLDTPPTEPYRIWARVCLGEVCGPGTSQEVVP